MREIRKSGSEGGGAGKSTGPPYPYVKKSPLKGTQRILFAEASGLPGAFCVARAFMPGRGW